MSTHPYIPLYVDDYDAATAHLTAEEDGVYSRLIRLTWRTPGCSLPNDQAWIARKVRVATADVDRVLAPVLSEFFTLQRGRLIQRRLKREYDNISRKKTARKLAGKKGGEAKARKALDNPPSNATGLSADTRAFQTQNQNHKEEEIKGRLVAEIGPDLPERRGASTRGTRLPGDWRPAVDDEAYAIREGFTIPQADRLAENFRDYWTAATGQKATKLDWSATWRTWVRNERDRRGSRPGAGQSNRVDFV